MMIARRQEQMTERILARVRRCAPASPESGRLFLGRIAENTARDPVSVAADVAAARELLRLLRDDPDAIDALIGCPAPGLFDTEGER